MLAALAVVDCCYRYISPLRADLGSIWVKLLLLISAQVKAPVDQAQGEGGCCLFQVKASTVAFLLQGSLGFFLFSSVCLHKHRFIN